MNAIGTAEGSVWMSLIDESDLASGALIYVVCGMGVWAWVIQLHYTGAKPLFMQPEDESAHHWEALEIIGIAFWRAVGWPYVLARHTVESLIRTHRKSRLVAEGHLFFHPDLSRLTRNLRRHPDSYQVLLQQVDPALVVIVDAVATAVTEGGRVTTGLTHHQGGVSRQATPVDLVTGLAAHIELSRTFAVNRVNRAERLWIRNHVVRRSSLSATHWPCLLANVVAGVINGRLDRDRWNRTRQALSAAVPDIVEQIDVLFARISVRDPP